MNQCIIDQSRPPASFWSVSASRALGPSSFVNECSQFAHICSILLLSAAVRNLFLLFSKGSSWIQAACAEYKLHMGSTNAISPTGEF